MARPCTICTHPQRAELDAALAIGTESNRALAAKYGVTERSLRRHAESHLPAQLVKAQEAREVAQADDLLAQVQGLQGRTLAILKTAEEQADLRTALAAIREARGNLELLGKLAGQLHEQELRIAVVTASPDWLRLRGAILLALDPYPDARLAVVGALAHAG